jgi:hypothetical protein
MLRAPIDARTYRDLYSNLETRAEAGDPTAREIKGVIDQAWKGVATAFKDKLYTADNSDAAEAMVGFLTCYFIESNPSFRPLFAAVPATA